MKIQQKLDLLCTRSSITRADLERIVSPVSKSTLNQWFRGRARPDLESAFRIAKLFHVSLEWLADDQAEFPPQPARLPDDEEFVLELYRTLGLTRFQAVRALSQAPFLTLRPSDDPNKRLVRYYHLLDSGEPPELLAEHQIDLRLLTEEDKRRLASQLTDDERRELEIPVTGTASLPSPTRPPKRQRPRRTQPGDSQFQIGGLCLVAINIPLRRSIKPKSQSLVDRNDPNLDYAFAGDCDLFVPTKSAVSKILEGWPLTSFTPRPTDLALLVVARGPLEVRHPHSGCLALPGPSSYIAVWQP